MSAQIASSQIAEDLLRRRLSGERAAMNEKARPAYRCLRRTLRTHPKPGFDSFRGSLDERFL